MNKPPREQRDQNESEPQQRNRYASSGYGSDEYRGGSGRAQQQGAQKRNASGNRQATRGHSDRDMQGEYSTGGYGQAGSSSGSYSGSARERSDYLERGYGREGSYPQSRANSSDDFGPRYQGSRGGQSAYGTQSYESGNYGSENENYGSQDYGAPDYGRETGNYASGDYGAHPRGQRMQGQRGQEYESSNRSDYGSHGREGYGAREYREQGYGMGGTTGNQPRASGAAGQGYGEQGYTGGSAGVGGGQYQAGSYGQNLGYRGVGPRNYSRSDERIREDLNERLTDADDIDASEISVEINNGIATLSGMVVQRWMKHRAEDIAESCGGVRDVSNQIRVGSQSGSQGTSGSSQDQGMYGSSQGMSGSQGASGSSQGMSGNQGTSGSSTSTAASGSSASTRGSAAGSSGTSGTSTGSFDSTSPRPGSTGTSQGTAG